MYLDHPLIPPLQHVEHCVQILRAKFVCEADTTPYAVMDDPVRGKRVDVRTKRSCYDTSKARKWLEEARREQGWENPDIF